jgi:hypothetical protein
MSACYIECVDDQEAIKQAKRVSEWRDADVCGEARQRPRAVRMRQRNDRMTSSQYGNRRYYARMAQYPSKAIYVVALGYPVGPGGMAFSPFDSITFEADSDAEAKKKAKEWAMKSGHKIDAQTWLQLTRDGRGIYAKPME